MIFSFLFGYSLVKLIESTQSKGLNTNAIVVRRSFGLIVLGILHKYLFGIVIFFFIMELVRFS
ncbi:hypothetical protein [Bacillus sp. Bos-x628]|uniref:hypothetical protein n=1 Tax=Bacillus maqinnsis TaxID=3229854 RepID=UPI00338EC01A